MTIPPVTIAAGRALLGDHGHRPGAELGSGMEGTVVALADDALAAKIWHGRARDEVERLRGFYDAVARLGLPFATPQVLDLLVTDDVLVTVERRLRGVPLDVAAFDDRTVEHVAAVLAALAGAEPGPGLDVLPPLDGPLARTLPRLVERRAAGSVDVWRRRLPDVDRLVPAVVAALEALPEATPRLLHGDLVLPNILVDDGAVSAVLDFGFLTTVGDPAFDAAITASIVDMYGPQAREHERQVEQVLDVDPHRFGVYRAAYALATGTLYSAEGADGHFAWCLAMLERPEVRACVS